MKVHSLAFIKECPDKAPLEAVEGTITKLFGRKSGTTAKGEWSLQNGELMTPEGPIGILFNGCPEVDQSWRNKKVRICSTVHDNKRSGLYAHDDKYKGNQTRIVRMTSTYQMFDLAQAHQGGGLVEAFDQRNAPPSQQAPAPAPEPQRVYDHAPQTQNAPTRQPQANGDFDFVTAVRQKIAKIACLQSVCYDAAVHNAHRIFENHGIAIMPGAVGVMGDKIFMETIRRIDIDLLPMDSYKQHPFKGKPMDILIPHMRQQIAEGKAEIDWGANEARHALGQQAMTQAANTPPPIAEEHVDETVPF